MTPEPLLTVAEYADLARYSRDHVRLLCHAGKVAGAVKVFGQWRIPRSAVPGPVVVVPTETEAQRMRRGQRAIARARAAALGAR